MWRGRTVSAPGFEEFVAARGPRLLRVAWLLTGDAHLAEDLLQTVLARVWPTWHRIADENPEAYVRKALVHTHASWWRRRWRGEVPHGDLPDRAATDDPFAEVDLGQALGQAIRALPVRQRSVVVLRYFEDLSVTETAAVLGCSEGTVKSQAAKALRTLRGRLPGGTDLVGAAGGPAPGVPRPAGAAHPASVAHVAHAAQIADVVGAECGEGRG
ncbi:SigE family RNA polymerase sigma factor [Actinacidiphila acidipaludis]|uniref:SigE family RNA polymerase sigma factor n=1 Tax=Actinacidiphila acidipaludis TaxID=2873382 RepID=A0ABS7QBN5_9ACTN|nr:SigE family RNA polymerase sigma factor [Streptomyces acidipaludis]MBY8880556.1 SigE family RNA polymerase sigma factor [Streptomyces acidipaludis]